MMDAPTHPRLTPTAAPLTAWDRDHDLGALVPVLLFAASGKRGYTALHTVCAHLAALYDERDAAANRERLLLAALRFYATGTVGATEGGAEARRVLAAMEGMGE